MRHIFLTLFISLISLCANAQPKQNLTISGHLTDADAKESLVQATVQLFRSKDSTFVGGTVTDLHGNFSIEAPSNGIYRLRLSSIGFQTIEREVTLRNNRGQELGDLMMSPETVMLKEAVVTGRAAQVVVRKDTLVYNPEA